MNQRRTDRGRESVVNAPPPSKPGLNQRLTEELNRRDGEIQELRQQLNELKTALWKKSEQTR